MAKIVPSLERRFMHWIVASNECSCGSVLAQLRTLRTPIPDDLRHCDLPNTRM